jgi:uncharacterized lipoprotein
MTRVELLLNMQLTSSHWAKVALIGCLSLATAACSGLAERRVAERDFDYLDGQLIAPLSVPRGIDAPKQTDTFSITPLNASNSHRSNVGSMVDVRSPALVIPLIEGGRSESSDKGMVFWFDLLHQADDKESKQLIFEQLKDFLSRRDVAVLNQDLANLTLETDWVIEKHRYKTGFFWSKSDYQLKTRYRYRVVSAAAQRIGLQVELLDIEQSSQSRKVLHVLDQFEKTRQSTLELNRLIDYISAQRLARSQAKVNRQEQAKLAAMSDAERAEYNNQRVILLLDDQEGATTYLAQANMERTLTRLNLALEQMGYKTTDYSEAAGKIYLEYKRPDQKLLDSYGIGDMRVKKTELILTLGFDGRQTRISLADSSEQLLKRHDVVALYPYFEIMMKRDNQEPSNKTPAAP